MTDFRTLLGENGYIIFDGGMGTMLQAAGLQPGTLPEDWNLTHPEEILKVHKAYVEAGSDVVTTNTFGANSRKYGKPVAGVIKAAVEIARKSGAKYVAQDIGPIGVMLKPLGDFEFDDAYELFKEQVIAGKQAQPDLFIIETMTDLQETRAAVLAVKENSDIPVVASMSFEKNGRTFLGASAASAAITLCGLGVDAVGVNCSLGPAELGPIVEELCRWSTVPVIVQANAGLPSSVDGRTVYNVGPGEYCRGIEEILKSCDEKRIDRVRLLGGCCGTNPEYIKGLRTLATGREKVTGTDLAGQKRNEAEGTLTGHAVVCSASTVVDYDNKTAIVGERLNPTGKKKISAALREGNYDLLIAEALQEYECGAEILDVNAGLPDIDERTVLIKLINDLQGACPLPLQIDTTDAEALEAAVRHYNGKPIINSVNGKEESLNTVLPIAAKYGAAVICLTLDENGIPSKAEERIAIARRIMERAEALGIPRRNLIIDGLVMTVSTNQTEARETLKTVGMARAQLGLHTCLGVSNISFGLPNREIMNATFLAEAFTCGLNLPIIDPTKERYMQTVHAHRVLSGEDVNSVKYIDYATKHPVTAATGVSTGISGAAAGSAPANTQIGEKANGTGAASLKSVTDIIEAGNRLAIEERTRELLETRSAMDVINGEFIPALDRVGELYEQGTIFLPQLMSSAETAKRGFDIIKAADKGGDSPKRMKIAIATVKGDIHDIGKNIVRMLLENYGYEVLDLGKDAAPELIASEVRKQGIRLVGLSALMTTTVRSMEDTIKLLRTECPDCKIMVGGAVLTEELAKKIGADYYAKDAAESARIAAEVWDGGTGPSSHLG